MSKALLVLVAVGVMLRTIKSGLGGSTTVKVTEGFDQLLFSLLSATTPVSSALIHKVCVPRLKLAVLKLLLSL